LLRAQKWRRIVRRPDDAGLDVAELDGKDVLGGADRFVDADNSVLEADARGSMSRH